MFTFYTITKKGGSLTLFDFEAAKKLSTSTARFVEGGGGLVEAGAPK